MKGSEEVVLITWFTATLTSGFINWNDGHNGYKRVGLLRSKKRQRSIICGLLKVSRKGFEVFFCVCVCLFASCTCSVERISRRSEGQEWSEQPSKSWRNFNRWPPRNQNLGYCSLVFPCSLTWRVFSHCTRHRFHRIWKNIVFEVRFKTLSCFWKVLIRKIIVEYQGVCIMPGQGSWERLPLQKKRPEHFTCFLSIDVIISLNVVFQNFSLVIDCCCFRTAQRRYGYWVYLFYPNIKHYNNLIRNYGEAFSTF